MAMARGCLISIHAPPRGATMKKYREKEGIKFQFTPLREGRPSRRTRQECRLCDFNSRPSARGDSKKCDLALDIYISIHAPPRGATRDALCCVGGDAFQFTPLREGRPLRFSFPHATRVFQFTPLREGRLRVNFGGNIAIPFQFTPLREGRLPVHQESGGSNQISIHAPPRGATSA